MAVMGTGDILSRCSWVPVHRVAGQGGSLGVHVRAEVPPESGGTGQVRMGPLGGCGGLQGSGRAVTPSAVDMARGGRGQPGLALGRMEDAGPTLTSRLFSPIAPLASQWQMIVSTAAPCLSVCLSALCRSWPRRFLSCVAARALPTPSFGC